MKEDNNDFLDELENMSIEEIEGIFNDIIEFDKDNGYTICQYSQDGCSRAGKGWYPK